MSVEHFQLTDNGATDKSYSKTDFIITHQQQGFQLNNCDQNIDFTFGEKINYHEIGNEHL